MKRLLALVVDEDAQVRGFIGRVLEHEGLTAIEAESGTQAAALLGGRRADLVLADAGGTGVVAPDLLRLPGAPTVIALAAGGLAPHAAEWIKAGAVDVLTKPLDAERLRQALGAAQRHRALTTELARLREELRSRTGPGGLVGCSAPLIKLRERLERLAPADSGVWFTGERGAGREAAARTLHTLSGRSSGPFVVVRGAGGALDELAQRAAGGVLYLDDLPALPREPQARLRDLLAREPAFRVCGSAIEAASVAVERGRLLPELAARVAGETVHVPALRERVEDIPLLARHFVAGVCSINFLPPIPIAPEALELLQSYAWPENVRELRNAMEHAVIVALDGTIRPRDLPEPLRRAERPRGADVDSAARRFREAKREVVDRFECAYLGELMQRHGGNVTAASHQAGMLRSALQRLLRKHRIKSAEFRPAGRPGPVERARTSN